MSVFLSFKASPESRTLWKSGPDREQRGDVDCLGCLIEGGAGVVRGSESFLDGFGRGLWLLASGEHARKGKNGSMFKESSVPNSLIPNHMRHMYFSNSVIGLFFLHRTS